MLVGHDEDHGGILNQRPLQVLCKQNRNVQRCSDVDALSKARPAGEQVPWPCMSDVMRYSINQSIEMQDQLCQWTNRPKTDPKTQDP